MQSGIVMMVAVVLVALVPLGASAWMAGKIPTYCGQFSETSRRMKVISDMYFRNFSFSGSFT